jgi:hypothetical protein
VIFEGGEQHPFNHFCYGLSHPDDSLGPQGSIPAYIFHRVPAGIASPAAMSG